VRFHAVFTAHFREDLKGLAAFFVKACNGCGVKVRAAVQIDELALEHFKHFSPRAETCFSAYLRI